MNENKNDKASRPLRLASSLSAQDELRYSRQIRFAPIGIAGQQQLINARVLVLGLGALGSASAEMLTRAGVGHLRIVDRDFVELSNLQRQSLYREADALEGTPKAIAAAKRLQSINSQLVIEPHVLDVTPKNILGLAASVDLIIDGTDHFDIRFLINDAAVHTKIPWVFGGCLGAEGQVMAVVPGVTACLRCLMSDGSPGTVATCDTQGILGPIVQVVAAVQVAEGLKILTGNMPDLYHGLQTFSLWEARSRQISTKALMDPQSKNHVPCPTCQLHQLEWLLGERFGGAIRLCGRNSVQFTPGEPRNVDLNSVASALADMGEVTISPYLLRLRTESHSITLFPDGRAIIEGTEDLVQAKALYVKYFG